MDDEEGFYIFLNSFLKIKPDTKNDALFLYEEKYRAEKLVCLLSVDGRLQIKRGEEIVGRADEKTRLSFRKSRWQRSDTNENKSLIIIMHLQCLVSCLLNLPMQLQQYFLRCVQCLL